MKGNNASWKLIEVDCQPIVIVYLALLPINPATNKISSAKIQRWWAVSAYIFCITLWEGGGGGEGGIIKNIHPCPTSSSVNSSQTL